MPNISFDKPVNTDTDTSPFQTVLFGRQMPLLEVELNEMQELLHGNTRNIAATYIGNTIAGDVVTEGDKLLCLGNALIGGYNLHIQGIQLDKVPDADYWFNVKECTLDKDSTVRKYGYVDGDIIENTILDKRWNIETTKRKAIEFSITNEEETDSQASVNVFHYSSDGKITFNIPQGIFSTFKGSNSSEDGKAGMVPKPLTGEQGKVLKADGTWGYPTTITTVDGTKMRFSIEDGHVKVIYDE